MGAHMKNVISMQCKNLAAIWVDKIMALEWAVRRKKGKGQEFCNILNKIHRCYIYYYC